jgi:hypothetical protein
VAVFQAAAPVFAVSACRRGVQRAFVHVPAQAGGVEGIPQVTAHAGDGGIWQAFIGGLAPVISTTQCQVVGFARITRGEVVVVRAAAAQEAIDERSDSATLNAALRLVLFDDDEDVVVLRHAFQVEGPLLGGQGADGGGVAGRAAIGSVGRRRSMRAAAVGFGQSKLPRSSPTVSPRSTNLAASVRRFCAITDSLRMAGRSVAFVTWVGGSSTSLVDTPMRWARLATACA